MRSNRLCIKGRHSDEAVLCTENQTFTMREMTQSNSILLCAMSMQSDGIAPACQAQVRSNVAEIWELTPIVARTGRIPQLLKESLYSGEEDDKRTSQGVSLMRVCTGVETASNGCLTLYEQKRYTPQQLASIVQASAKELQDGIHDSHVILLDGECARPFAGTWPRH